MAVREEELLPSAVPLRLSLAASRGFCARVARAIDALEAALARFGPPLHARHGIVHNPAVVERPLREDTTSQMPSLDPRA
jgi:4-hydroxy-3-methylbut-2-enyl diphosphate reductase IspH